MSTYALSKLLREVNRNPGIREHFFKDAAAQTYSLESPRLAPHTDLTKALAIPCWRSKNDRSAL